MSRADNVGLWWEDYPVERASTRGPIHRNVEPPHTGWQPPTSLPNLSGVPLISIDTETKDLELTSRGPGAVRGAGHIVGVSVAVDDAAWYFPLRHEYEPQTGLNMDPGQVLGWLKDLLARPKLDVVGANLLYDLEFLRAEGIHCKGQLFDVQYAEPLLDESAFSYSLEALAKKYLGEGKDSGELYKWCAASFGGKPDPKQRAHIWRAPPTLVGPYAESDARLPLQILRAQESRLEEEELSELFAMECDLIPLLLDMRFRGVRINEERAQEVSKWLRARAAEMQHDIPGVDVWSGDSIARAFGKAKLGFPLTPSGSPSFTKEFLESLDHPLATGIVGVRTYEKAANPFVESYVIGSSHNGRVHCQFHPLRDANYGTVSGRFSSSNPNLQNIPSRDTEIGPMIRSLFIPEEGCDWWRADYSQIEYRALAHFAIGEGADDIRARYNDDPNIDFHEIAIATVHEITGILLDRKSAKNLNFGLIYGMGREKLTKSLGVGGDLGERLYDAYFEGMPMVKKTYRSAERLATRRGYIRTILGRRRRFGPDDSTHKALNSCLQGTAADIHKKALVEAMQAGLFDILGPPHLIVHDESDLSAPRNKEAAQALAELARIMVQCVKLRVPLKVDISTGPDWGACK